MPIKATVVRTAMGRLNQPVLGQMGHLGFDHQYTTQIKVIIFGQNWPIERCFPIFAFFDKFTSVIVF